MPLIGPELCGPAELANPLTKGLSGRSDQLALVSATDTWTWRELERDINALSVQLAVMGLKQGDRVASLMPNRGELLIHYLACLRAGLVVTPLNYRYTAPEIIIVLEQMPINATGKVDRLILKKWAADRVSVEWVG